MNVGILDPLGENPNPLTGKPYSEEYRKLAATWSTFPAYDSRNQILDSIAKYPVTFVVSGTGSGKTVIVPKLALHYLNYQGTVAVSLPKKTITLSSAEFSAKTLDVKLGKEVGYKYRGSPNNSTDDKTKLFYLTDGTLIVQFLKDPLLTKYDIVVIDEAHERKVQIDMLLLILKQLINSGKRPHFRLIIMSATIDTNLYQNYFRGIRSNVIHLSGTPHFPIKRIFLTESTDSYLNTGIQILQEILETTDKGDILFFITTTAETVKVCQLLRQKFASTFCIEVHANMPVDQKRFAERENDYQELGSYNRKVVIATNVAESSLTIENLAYVIDGCHELFVSFEPKTMSYSMEKQLITKAQAMQREGRTGRTGPGTCFHLLTEEEFDRLKEFPVPSILKEDITMEFLKIIYLFKDSENPLDQSIQMLNELMDPPKPLYQKVSIELLKGYEIVTNNGKLTEFGRKVSHLTSLPFHLALMAVYGYQYYLGRIISQLICLMESINFRIPNLFIKDVNISREQMRKISQKDGDYFTLIDLLNKYQKAKDGRAWAEKNNLNYYHFSNAIRKSYILFQQLRELNIPREQTAGKGKSDPMKNIMTCIKLSHYHQIIEKGRTVYPIQRVYVKISSESFLSYHYNLEQILRKRLIYHELIEINGDYEIGFVNVIR